MSGYIYNIHYGDENRPINYDDNTVHNLVRNEMDELVRELGEQGIDHVDYRIEKSGRTITFRYQDQNGWKTSTDDKIIALAADVYHAANPKTPPGSTRGHRSPPETGYASGSSRRHRGRRTHRTVSPPRRPVFYSPTADETSNGEETDTSQMQPRRRTSSRKDWVYVNSNPDSGDDERVRTTSRLGPRHVERELRAEMDRMREEFRRQLDALSGENQGLRGHLEQAYNELRAAQATIEGQRSTVLEFAGQVLDTPQADPLRALHAVANYTQELKNQITLLEASNGPKDAQIQQLRQELEASQQARLLLEREKAQSGRTPPANVAELENQIRTLTSELDNQIRGRAEDSTARLTRPRDDSDEITRLQKELSDAKANLAGAQRRAEALVAEVDRLRSERAGAGDRGDQAAVARLTQLLETKEAEIARITGRADASDAKLHQYGQQIASLQGELRGRLSPEQVQHLNEQIRQLTAERGALEQRLTAQTPHIEHLETQLATATRAKDQINAKAKRIIDGLKEKLVEAEQVQGRENRNLKRQINQVKAAAAQEASAKDHEIAGLKGALTEAQKAAPSPAITQLLQQLRDQIGTMQREMSAMQRRGEGLPEAEKAAFTEREQELVVRIGALEQQVVNAENIARSEQAHKRELASIKEQLSTLLNKRVDTDNIEVLMRMIRDIPRSVDNSAQLERLEVAVGQLRNTDTRALQNEIITLREQLAASNKASREAEGRLLRNLQEAGTANNARLGELTAEVARLTEMLETSTRNDGVRAAQVATLENKLRGARAEIERLSVEIKEEPDPGLQSELDQANRRLRSLEEQRDHMQDIAVSAQLRNNALETANAALQDELKTQNDELQGIHDTLQSARDELLAAFKKADNDIDYMRDEIRDADRAAAWALNEADTLRDELTQKEEEITNLQKQLTENKRGNIAMQVDLNQRIDNLIQEKNRLKNLYRVIDEAQTSIIDALKSVIEGKNENLEQHRNRLIDAQVALSVALENQTQVDTSIDSLTDMVIELQGRLDHVLGEKASLEESFQTELFHKQSLQDRIATLTEDRNQLLEANHTINAEKEAMIDDLTAELHAVSQTLLQLQDEIQKCAAAESEIKQQHRLVMNAAREYNEDIVKRHAEEISTLQKQLSDQRIAKKEKTKLTRALAEEQEKYRKAETELNKMRSGNEQLAKALIKSHADFYSLHAKRREEIAKLSSQLETQGIETKQQAEWLRDFTRQMNEMFMENLSEREMINGLPDVIRKMLLHISTLESDISYLSTAERSIENLEDVNDETRAELTRVKSQLENAEVQLWTAKRTIGDLEDQAKTAKIDTRLAEQGKELAEAELAFVKARLTNAKGRISENTNRHIDEIIEKNAALRTVESELQGVLEEVQGIRPVAEELQQRIVDLQRDRDDLAAQVNELKGQLEETF